MAGRNPPSATHAPTDSRRSRLAILFADIAGYTRLMEADEVATHIAHVTLQEEVVWPAVARHLGRLVKTTGDGFLATFADASAAGRCAIEIQQEAALRATSERVERRLYYRMGLNAASVLIERDDVYGEGVNLAARLQAYAEPGTLVLPASIADQVLPHVSAQVEDLGDLHLKNVTRPVRAVSLRPPGAPAMTPPPPRASDQRPSIVVLPFHSQGDAQDDYFADGVVDEIIHALGGLKQLFVISRGSTLGYRGQDVDLRQLGREFGVSYCLRGGIRRRANKVRLTTELTDAQSGAVMRADRYDGDLADLFSLQDRIAVEVVRHIAPHVQDAELRRTARKHPENMYAYDFMLQALDQLYRLDYASFSRARGLLQQAIAEDPTYATAHSYLAYWHILRVGQGWSPDSAADARDAERRASAAIARDQNDALGLAIYGHVHAYLRHDFRAAVALFHQALEAGPNNAMAWSTSSLTSAYLGDGPTAVARAEHGLRLSPRDAHAFWPLGALALAHYVNGDLVQAVHWAEQARNSSRRFTSNHRILAASLAGLGRLDEAQAVATEALAIDPAFRLSTHMARAPWSGQTRETLIARLRAARFPD